MNKTGVNRNTKRQPHWNGKNPAQIPDAAPRSRTALDPVAYDNLIKQHGVRVKVYRSMYCPNVKSVDGGEHNLDCTLCNGSGYLDVDPLESVAYLANQNFQEEMTVEGYHDGNSVGATFLGGVELQYFTRVDLMDFTQPFYERVLRRADANPGTNGTPGSPSIPGTKATITLTYNNNTPATDSFIVFNNDLSAFFNVIDDEGATLTDLVLGDFNVGAPDGAVERHNAEILFVPSESSLSSTEKLQDLKTLIDGISKDPDGTRVDPRNPEPRGARIQRICEVTIAANSIILTQDTPTTTNLGASFVNGDVSAGFSNGIAPIPAVLPQLATNQVGDQDNLKYDCKRVNVIIDKEANQYYQDIDFRLTPQGNVQWIRRVADNGTSSFVRIPALGTIYTTHYESVIQYRATSAMHINRFAQVPDRSTGLVAQVKMPEQWMLQKEFLIVRRDEYGNEIKKTGIFGDVIAAQPLNPAPSDSI